jgi:hypothetical protein
VWGTLETTKNQDSTLLPQFGKADGEENLVFPLSISDPGNILLPTGGVKELSELLAIGS